MDNNIKIGIPTINTFVNIINVPIINFGSTSPLTLTTRHQFWKEYIKNNPDVTWPKAVDWKAPVIL